MIKFDGSWLGRAFVEESQQWQERAEGCFQNLLSGDHKGSEWTGWYNWPNNRGQSLVDEVQEKTDALSVAWDSLVVIGIGGSYLGARSIMESLAHGYQSQVQVDKPEVFWAGQHLSERDLVELLDALEEKNPLVVVVSKSGTTTEPGVAFRIMLHWLKEKYGEKQANKRVLAITDPKKGALRQMAEENSWTTFEVPADVGGRYSVLTAVGLVPLHLAGYDIRNLMNGAADFFQSINDQPQNHPCLNYAASRAQAFDKGYRVEVINYSQPRLGLFVEWWKQLFGESEGKDGKGLFPAGLCSTTDLHSLGQYLQAGWRGLIETFLFIDELPSGDGPVDRRLRVPALKGDTDQLGYLEGWYIEDINRKAMEATRLAHFDGDVPCLSLHLKKLDIYGLGQLVAFYQTACAVSGLMLDVNPFDQPGVEDYKKNLFALAGRPGYEGMAGDLKERLQNRQ